MKQHSEKKLALLYWVNLMKIRPADLKLKAAGIREYPRWRKTIAPGRNSVADRLPWMTFRAIEAIEQIATKEQNVFEWGSGGSTLFWADRCKSVVSVEHDAGWFGTVNDLLLAEHTPNAEYLLVEPENDPLWERRSIRNNTDCISYDKASRGKSFRKYVYAINDYPDAFFDIIVVDGRSRQCCIHTAIPKLKSGGYLILDNSERKRYLESNRELLDPARWERRSFSGATPYACNFSETSLFRKR